MSKSYNNTIPLFTPEKKLRKLIMKIKTNSQPPEEPKDPETCTLFQIFQAFADPAETDALRQRYRNGIAWGEMKQYLFEYLNDHLRKPRERYAELLEHPDHIEKILQEGARKARDYSQPFLSQIRRTIGIASLG
jgi:tryptophanyl-tRNA synthetase